MNEEYLEFDDVFDSGNWTVWQYVTDSAGNWYKIPSDMFEEFILLDEDEYKELDFLHMFEQYAVEEDSEGVIKAKAAIKAFNEANDE